MASLQAPRLAVKAGAVLEAPAGVLRAAWVAVGRDSCLGAHPGLVLSWPGLGVLGRGCWAEATEGGSVLGYKGTCGTRGAEGAGTAAWQHGVTGTMERWGAGPLWIPAPGPHPGEFSELGAYSAGAPGPRSLARCPLQGRGRGSAGAPSSAQRGGEAVFSPATESAGVSAGVGGSGGAPARPPAPSQPGRGSPDWPEDLRGLACQPSLGTWPDLGGYPLAPQAPGKESGWGTEGPEGRRGRPGRSAVPRPGRASWRRPLVYPVCGSLLLNRVTTDWGRGWA